MNKIHKHDHRTIQHFGGKPLTTEYAIGLSETKFSEIARFVFNAHFVKGRGVPDPHQAPQYEKSPLNCVAVHKSRNFPFSLSSSSAGL